MEFGSGSAPGRHYPPPPLPPRVEQSHAVGHYPAKVAGYAPQDGFPQPHAVLEHGYPPPYLVGYPAPVAGYAPQDGYLLPHAVLGYGNPPPHAAGYGHAWPPVQKPQQKNKKKFGLGLISELLNGLFIIDKLSDVSDMGANDAGYGAGVDDAGGFEF